MTMGHGIVGAWKNLTGAAILLVMICSTPLSAADGSKTDEFACLEKLIADARKNPKRQAVLAAQAVRQEALILSSDRDPLDIVLRRTRALLDHLRPMPAAPDLTALKARLDDLATKAAAVEPANRPARRQLFDQLIPLRREVALANPLLNFDRLLFIKRQFLPGSEPFGNHMCQQYYGFYQFRIGGLYVLENPFGANSKVRDVLANSVCRNGRFKGKKLENGSFLSPELSFDGKMILFAWTEAEPTKWEWTERSTYHIFKVNVDGSNLTQLTDGPWNDFDPCFLPNGRIVFISERRGGYGRCHPEPKPNYVLHAMNADGGDIVCLSRHESNEWQPSVDHDGMIAYTRWDYVDRGAFQAHNPWLTTPDGRDAREMTGNYPSDWHNRPLMTMDLRAIPNSRQYISTAAAHHGQAYGSLILVDPLTLDDNMMSPYARLTPEVPFPESEPEGREVYGTPWPLDKDFYLCVYDPEGSAARGPKNNFGLHLLDSFGNKVLIYADPTVSCLSPIPLRPRPKPPTIPDATFAAGDPSLAAAQSGVVGITNVYQSTLPWPKETRIKALRIVQVLPKTTWRESAPRIGHGFQKGARAVLGTVPVEEDGSAYFTLPAGKPVFFQALDERGLAVQSMRSDTYVHPGQQLFCRGCHEPRHRSPATPSASPLAFRRAPSAIQPDVDGSNPFSYPRLVQPVLDRNCVACHEKNPKSPDLRAGDYLKNPDRWYTSYINLKAFTFYVDHLLWNDSLTTPGQFGARASKLLPILDKGHHDTKLSPEDLHRLTLWLDCNSDFYGSYDNTDQQAKGQIVRPTLE